MLDYEVADSWQKRQGRWQYRFGFALKIHVPKEYWTKGNEKMGFTVLLRQVSQITFLIGRKFPTIGLVEENLKDLTMFKMAIFSSGTQNFSIFTGKNR